MAKLVMLTRKGAGLAVLTIVVLSVMPGRMRPHILLAICAGSLEFVQLWIPGRTSSVGGFASATVGAWIGLLVMIVIRRAHERKFVVSYK